MVSVRRLAASGLILGGLGLLPAPSAQEAAPRLLVVLVVDQMRFDYIEQTRDRWTRGLKRLVTEGAVFERNYYPYLQTVTCAGHATIGTGSFPATHGIILNAWWRGTRSASCTDDSDVRSVAYEPNAEVVGHSPRELRVPTLADRLRARSPASRVVTLSMKPRSAIMLAGKGGIVTWLDDRNVWATSTAFSETAHPAVQAFVDAHPRSVARGEVWDRLLSPEAYKGSDAGVGEAPPRGWTPSFPHPLAGAPGTPDAQFDTLWETSPYADAYLGSMAASLVQSMKLGQGEAVDYLGVSFSALDYVGHAFGPASHEVQDTLIRLDRTVGDLLDALDTHVGRDRYVLGLSADHGVAPVPEARRAAGQSGGRLVTQQLLQVANDALAKALGPGQHVVRVEYTQLYLSAAAQEAAAENPHLLRPVVAALARVPGVARVLVSSELETRRNSKDPVVRAAALSHVHGRSGQLVVVPRAYFTVGPATARGTTHGTLHPYDQHVPLVFFGHRVKAGRYQQRATPADLAPTLAATIDLAMPGIDGVAHSSVFRRP